MGALSTGGSGRGLGGEGSPRLQGCSDLKEAECPLRGSATARNRSDCNWDLEEVYYLTGLNI